MAKHIKCARCRFAQRDPKASDSEWTAYQCGNPKSEYHKALINVTLNGDKQELISWTGCVCGIPRKRGDA